MAVEIVPATEAHARAMVGRLRPGDATELAALGMTDREALMLGLRVSSEAWTALVEGEPAAMWGLAPESILGDEAHPWLITTALMERHKKRFLRECRAQVVAMRGKYRLLTNYVHTDYPEADRLVRWLGFSVAEDGPGPFRRVEMRT